MLCVLSSSNPVVCAITSLGYDHVDVLGDTLEQIAWHKGGICKVSSLNRVKYVFNSRYSPSQADRPVFTLPQPEEPLRALAERAKELKVSEILLLSPLLILIVNSGRLGRSKWPQTWLCTPE